MALAQRLQVPASLCPGVAAVGVVVALIGTFLPWLRSGVVMRDSYQAATVLHDLVGGTAGGLLTAWPMVIPAWSLCVALHALGLRRVSAALGYLFGVLTAAVAGLVLAQDAQPYALLGPVTSGPSVTLVGVVLVLVGATGVVAGSGDRDTATRGGLR
jgi:hypothetical protein